MFQKNPRKGLLPEIEANAPFQEKYLGAIHSGARQIKTGLQAVFHSLYLSGALAHRNAEETSDLEFTLVSMRPLNTQEYAILNTIKWRIKESNQAIKHIRIDLVLLHDVLHLRHIFRWGFFLKHCTVCLEGENLAHRFGRFEVSWEVSKAMNIDFEARFNELKRKFISSHKLDTQLDVAEEMGKLLVKTSFSLVAHKEMRWEENLQKCADAFLIHYPKKELEISRLFLLIQRKNIKKRAVIALLDAFYTWILFEMSKIEKKRG